MWFAFGFSSFFPIFAPFRLVRVAFFVTQDNITGGRATAQSGQIVISNMLNPVESCGTGLGRHFSAGAEKVKVHDNMA